MFKNPEKNLFTAYYQIGIHFISNEGFVYRNWLNTKYVKFVVLDNYPLQ